MENTDLNLKTLDLSDNQDWHQAVELVTKNFLTSLASGNSEAIKWDGVAREDSPKVDYSKGKQEIYRFFDYMCKSYIPTQVSTFDSTEISPIEYLKSIFNHADSADFFNKNQFDRDTTRYLQLSFGESKRIVEFYGNLLTQNPTIDPMQVASLFLNEQVGTMHKPANTSELSPAEKRAHLLGQRISTLSNQGKTIRIGLDLHPTNTHCAAPFHQIKEMVYIVTNAVYHFYPLLLKRQQDLNK